MAGMAEMEVLEVLGVLAAMAEMEVPATDAKMVKMGGIAATAAPEGMAVEPVTGGDAGNISIYYSMYNIGNLTWSVEGGRARRRWCWRRTRQSGNRWYWRIRRK